MSGSPPPRHEAAYFDAGRGERWYVTTGARWERDVDAISGGPFETEAEAQAEVERRYAEMHKMYEEVERDAREKGYTVAW